MEKAIAIDKNFLLLENGELLEIKDNLEFGKIYNFDFSNKKVENLEKIEEENNWKISFSTGRKIYDKFDNAYIIDVREGFEFFMNGIDEAINIPLGKIESIYDKKIKEDDIVMVYCRSGKRSKKAQDILLNLGFKLVLDVGGILDYNGEFDNYGDN